MKIPDTALLEQIYKLTFHRFAFLAVKISARFLWNFSTFFLWHFLAFPLRHDVTLSVWYC